MSKDFDEWNGKKKRIEDEVKNNIYFHEREVWWVSAGLNLGHEQDGKGQQFLRPFLLLKKFNRHLIYAVPLSTKLKQNPFYIPCVISDGVQRMAIISQMKPLSSKRLYGKIGHVSMVETEKSKAPSRILSIALLNFLGLRNQSPSPKAICLFSLPK